MAAPQGKTVEAPSFRPALPSRPPAARPSAAHSLSFLESLADPDWLPFVGVMLAPALVFTLIQDLQRAYFFAGLAVYVGVLKWLGWLLLARGQYSQPLLFSAHIFAGLAAVWGWFYVRSSLEILWPTSFGLQELALLPGAAVVIHLLAWARCRHRHPREPSQWARTSWSLGGRTDLQSAQDSPDGLQIRPTGRELLPFYLPFGLSLVVALARVSAALQPPASDGLHHAFLARVYRDFGATPGILYPTGFGALNAVTLALTPLTPVQAVTMQHVVLQVASLFLIPAVIAHLAGRPLRPLHSLPTVFLAVFPLYSLYPFIYYQGAARQTSIATLAALCLLPVLAPTARSYLLPALMSCLVVLTASLNPACVPFAILAGSIALLVLMYRSERRWLTLLIFGMTLVLCSVLLLANDAYLQGTIRALFSRDLAPDNTTSSSTESADSAPSTFTLWKISADAFGRFVFPVYEELVQLKSWESRLPFVVIPALAFLLAVVALWKNREKSNRPLNWVILGCLALWVLLKTSVGLFVEWAPHGAVEVSLLKAYAVFLLIRCEILIIFTIVLAAAVSLHVLQRPGVSPRKPWLLGGSLVVVVLMFLAPRCGFTAIPNVQEGLISPSDLELVAWLDANVPPEKGLVGLASGRLPLGRDPKGADGYCALCPLGGAQAVPLYSKHYNFCFSHPVLAHSFTYDDYRKHVAETLDVAWCRSHAINYFLVSRSSLPQNPGLSRAIAGGRLRLLKSAGESHIYRVVVTSADAD